VHIADRRKAEALAALPIAPRLAHMFLQCATLHACIALWELSCCQSCSLCGYACIAHVAALQAQMLRGHVRACPGDCFRQRFPHMYFRGELLQAAASVAGTAAYQGPSASNRKGMHSNDDSDSLAPKEDDNVPAELRDPSKSDSEGTADAAGKRVSRRLPPEDVAGALLVWALSERLAQPKDQTHAADAIYVLRSGKVRVRNCTPHTQQHVW
jgi:hypothetical protein